MATMVEDIIQALRNLGGHASLTGLYNEIERMRITPLTKQWKANVRGLLQTYSSDSRGYKGGKDYFYRTSLGWGVRDSFSEHTAPDYPSQQTTPSINNISAETFESISNTFRTIKEYRDYANPNSLASWQDYVQELFHLLGFSTEHLDSRLFAIKDMGAQHPIALMVYIQPGEDLEQAGPGVHWEFYLQCAASYHQVQWGILTNGLMLKVIRYKVRATEVYADWPEFDAVIVEEKIDTFFAIHKVFATIKSGKMVVPQPEKKAKTIARKRGDFSPKMSWKDAIYEAIQANGGEANLADIYEYLEQNSIREMTGNWHSTIRYILQAYCREANAYIGNDDVFRKTGISGRWGIKPR